MKGDGFYLLNGELIMHRHNLWIAILAATATLGTTATNADFIDDSNVQLKFKNFYLDRQYQDDY